MNYTTCGSEREHYTCVPLYRTCFPVIYTRQKNIYHLGSSINYSSLSNGDGILTRGREKKKLHPTASLNGSTNFLSLSYLLIFRRWKRKRWKWITFDQKYFCFISLWPECIWLESEWDGCIWFTCDLNRGHLNYRLVFFLRPCHFGIKTNLHVRVKNNPTLYVYVYIMVESFLRGYCSCGGVLYHRTTACLRGVCGRLLHFDYFN